MTFISIAAKVFPGQLQFQDLDFTEELKDKTSELFKSTSAAVTRDVSFSFLFFRDLYYSLVSGCEIH